MTKDVFLKRKTASERKEKRRLSESAKLRRMPERSKRRSRKSLSQANPWAETMAALWSALVLAQAQ